MKLSAVLGPLLDAKADHELIRKMVLAHEEAQADALEKRRESDRKRQAAKTERDNASRDSREPYDAVSSREGVTRVEDNLQTKRQTGEDKKDTSPSARSKRGTRIPDDFQPDIAAAVSEGVPFAEAERQARNFRDYWHSKPGKDGLKLDWNATWRLWFRKHIQAPLPARQATAPPRERTVSDVLGEIAAGTWMPSRTEYHEPEYPPIGISSRN